MLITVRDPVIRARARRCFAEDSARLRAGGRARRALETDVYVTNVCNLRCNYCYFYFEDYFDAPSHHEHGDPPLSHLEALLRNISGHTYCLVILGGEPFTRRDFGEFLTYARTMDIFSVRVTTNGLFLKRKKDVLPLIDALTVSIDAMRIRQYPKQMAKVLDDIHDLKVEFGDELPRVVPSWTTGPDDDFDRDVRPILDFAREHGFVVKFLPLKVDQHVDWKKQQEITLAATAYLGPEGVTNQLPHTLELAEDYGGRNCLVEGNQFYIDYDGQFLYPCDEYAHQKVGSAFDADLGTLYEEGVRRYGEYPVASSICAHCPSGCHSDNSFILRNPDRQLQWLAPAG